ncbi:MAG: nucleotidyltransferase family protein [Magnetovibrionaceae bacterium]
MIDDPAALDAFCVSVSTEVQDVLTTIDRQGEGLALVVGEDRELLGIITDGDVRRALLDGYRFSGTAGDFLAKVRKMETFKAPLTAKADMWEADQLELMEQSGVRHLPVVDNKGCLVGLELMSEKLKESDGRLHAVVMAGGFGKRLQPLTDSTPKPMLPVGDKPVLAHIVEQLAGSGIERVNITTHFQAEKIREHFGQGEKFGVEVRYTQEDKPLGTAGALSMLESADCPLLVINGDILTQTDFRAMHRFHVENNSDITVGVRTYDVSVPFGVIRAEGSRVTRLDEKPALSFLINAGIYLLEPRIVEKIPSGDRYDMTDLISDTIAAGGTVTSFPIHEYWLDIGQIEDYVRAQGDAKAGKLSN